MQTLLIGSATLAAGGVGLGLWLWNRARCQTQRFDTLNDSFTDLQKQKNKLQMQVGQLKRIEMDLRESESFNRALFEATQTGLIIVNTQTGQVLDANSAAGRLLGWDPDEMLGQLISTFMPSPGEEDGPCLALREQSGDAPVDMFHQGGHSIAALQSVTQLEASGGQDLVVVSFLDVTAHKAAEQELKRSHDQLGQAHVQLKKHKDQIVQSEKLASIGQLAAGVAHEINNPVGYVTSNLGTIQDYCLILSDLLTRYGRLDSLPLEPGEPRQTLQAEIAALKEEEDLAFILADLPGVLEESREGVQRVTEIVQNLKSFARDDAMAKGPMDINEGVESMIKMVWNELKYKCSLEKDLGEVPVVQGHAGQVNQVIMNMLVNASQAMPDEGGVVTVGTAVVGEDLEIRIQDNGSGMDEDTVSRIFDPFFTTKDVGKGTGLGLSISHGIISDHNGRIEVESTPGAGTTFRIYLPLAGCPEEDLIG